MIEPQWKYLEEYVRDLADRLYLRDWTIILKRTPPDTTDAGASMELTYGRKQAVMRLCDQFASDKPGNQRHYIVHELVHCHLDQTDTVMRQLEPLLGKAAFAVIEASHHTAVEYAADAIAEVVAPLMPACAIPAEEPAVLTKKRR